MPAQVTVSRHPLTLRKLTQLRDRATPPPLFRQLVRDLSQLLLYEASADIGLRPITVHTPLAESPGFEIADTIGIMPILARASAWPRLCSR